MGEKKCQAITTGGESCNNKAMFPEDNPVACHIKSHREQLGVLDETIKETSNKEGKVIKDETKTHVFSSEKIVHTIFVRFPKDDKRDFFRADFTGGRWETDSDEKAKLLQGYVANNKHIRNIIKKVQ